MAKTHKPKAGSLAYLPKKRAKRENPRVHSWPQIGESKILGYAGYKAGMTNVIAVDNRKHSSTSGMEVFVPVTIVEAPPIKVAAIRVYTDGYEGKTTVTDIWAKEIDKDLEKTLSISKKREDPAKRIESLKKDLSNISDVRLIVHTQPRLASMAKKTPDVVEMGIGGSVEGKIDYAVSVIGKDLRLKDVFEGVPFVDVVSVTKGKGFQGVIKRWGVKKQKRKSTGKERHMGSGGAWSPAKKLWTEPQAGQMGYHTRTEYNKEILKIGEDGSEITPKAGFLHYGSVKSDYIMLKGSIPGPAKRFIRLNYPKRQKAETNLEITHINTE